MKTVQKIIMLVVLLAAAGIGLWWYLSPEASRVTIHDATINDIKSMAQLSSMEIYEEVPIRGDIDTRHFVARVVLEGNVSFDIDKLERTEKGDTVIITLPPEIVTVRESTQPGSYIILDSWNDSFFGSDRFTTQEENSFKARAESEAVARFYDKGYVRQARAEAVGNLRNLVAAATPGKTVVVVDPSPDGYRK